MPSRTANSAVVDSLLKLIALGGLSVTILVAPSAVRLFDAPLKNFSKNLDARQRERELRKALRYMKAERLVTDDYEHGLRLTKKAQDRLAKLSFEEISIPRPDRWDNNWRLVFFDIPEPKKTQRDGFAAKLRNIGFQVLQRSVFVHPFPCRQQIEQIALHYGVEKFVSYVEAGFIDNQQALKTRFKNLI